MCRVRIDLWGPLDRYGGTVPPAGRTLTVPSGAAVRDVLEVLGLPVEHVGLVLVNGQKGRLSTCLAGDDVITFYPVVAGG